MGQLGMIYRFYCMNNDECSAAESELKSAGLSYEKLDTETTTEPILITPKKTCRGLPEIKSYLFALAVMKEVYSIDEF